VETIQDNSVLHSDWNLLRELSPFFSNHLGVVNHRLGGEQFSCYLLVVASEEPVNFFKLKA
jgi:hypothetical protein